VTHAPTTRIVILGGGFGGLYAALELEKTLARRTDLQVALDLVFSKDLVQLQTPRSRSVSALSDLSVKTEGLPEARTA
jgi:NADH dehydrogenase FAD-containing subunit